jgi:multisubunit Na+/H+ antiporter MnhE subunit
VRGSGRVARHRALAWCAAWLFAAAFYLLLIDITDLPELIVGAGAAVLAATGTELAREADVVRERFRAAWLRRLYRPILGVPRDVVLVSAAALAQLVSPKSSRGRFRAAPFTGSPSSPDWAGRGALAQMLGSFAPNTVVFGVDDERELILVHQLRVRGGRETIDVLELG